MQALSFNHAGARNVVENGAFAVRDDTPLPQGWQRFGDGEVTTHPTDDGAVVALHATAPNQTLGLRQTVALPDDRREGLRVAAEVRLDDVRRGKNSWHSGRIMVTYLDEAGGELDEPYSLDRLEGAKDWHVVSRQFPVPARAARVELQLFNAKQGTLSFRQVRVEALNRDAAQAWRADVTRRRRVSSCGASATT